ncbi:mannitol dehydrogenase [Marinomonas transparens]|uniref:Mannitol dehydrogenase n=1 Tax=Marinomonas transparens TaxID=2795388 RepID=A0A934JW63_9GAMM|nr:mannitol dehydrogenase [Marinomonas transparens]MBJ7539372.1 mannitol dehydrogenase [Marinomonas transparens]
MANDLLSPSLLPQDLIMQFGTSRFLQAHVDFFVGESIANGDSTSKIAIVQSSSNSAGKRRLTAFNQSSSYPVKVRGLQDGKIIDQSHQVQAIEVALQAQDDWQQIVSLFCQRVSHVVSNTADQGYQLDDSDHIGLTPPNSFPAKLLVLLKARFEQNPTPVTLMPCELVANNGDVLKSLVVDLASQWQLDDAFLHWLKNDCLWVNSLVDRIVSEAIEPIGAVTEPYALWAIEKQTNLTLPCQHSAIHLVDSLEDIEFLKLGVLNLSHTYLVDLWQTMAAENDDIASITTVREAMENPVLQAELEAVLQEEVVPVLTAMNLSEDVASYVNNVRERFLNPFLEHKLSDIAQHHQAKIERRILPIFEKGQAFFSVNEGTKNTLPRLSACLKRHGFNLVSTSEGA